MRQLPSPQQAFTLVELAIVIVIIGMIVGGILFGRELISQARMRKGLAQINEYKVAYKTFRLKYDCLPGDCNKITRFFNATSQPEQVTNGNGDGIIRGSGGGPLYQWGAGENNSVFDHLSAAGYVSFPQFDETPYVAATNETGITWPDAIFEARGDAKVPNPGVARSSDLPGIVIGNQGASGYIYGGNVMHIGICKHRQWSGIYIAGDCALNPWEGYYIDSKTDDGKPTSGKVIIVPTGAYMSPSNGFSTGIPQCSTSTYDSTTGQITFQGEYRSEQAVNSWPSGYGRTCLIQVPMDF